MSSFLQKFRMGRGAAKKAKQPEEPDVLKNIDLIHWVVHIQIILLFIMDFIFVQQEANLENLEIKIKIIEQLQLLIFLLRLE